MKIKHSKYKNTGILFELLVRQITSDTLDGVKSPATKILQKFFNKTELGKEYRLYETLLSKTSLTETKADVVVNTLVETSKTLNRRLLKKQKYNLINEISNHYNLNKFFNHKLPNYKVQAAFYTLLEIYNTEKAIDPNYIIDNKMTILEHLTAAPIQKKDVKNDLINEFKKSDKDTRMLAYKIMLEKFNEKYDDLDPRQKSILKEIIHSHDNRVGLVEFYKRKSKEIQFEIETLSKEVTDAVTKIKLNEVVSIIGESQKEKKITNDHLINLMQYCDLVKELEVANAQA